MTKTMRLALVVLTALSMIGALLVPASAQESAPDGDSLTLTTECIDPADDSVQFARVTNNESFDIEFTVSLGGTAETQDETYTVEGDSVLRFKAAAGSTVRISYGDDLQEVKGASQQTCFEIPEEGLDDEPDAPDDFGCTIELLGGGEGTLAEYHYVDELGDWLFHSDGASRAHINVDVACVHAYLTDNVVQETDSSDDFTDMDELSPIERAAVAYLAERDITLGFEDGEFKGEQTVRRQNTASFVWRAIEHADDNGAGSVDHDPDALGSEIYNDVSPANVHDANIGQASTAELWQGFPDGSYRPQTDVTNRQLHRVMLRWLDEQVPVP